MLSALLLLGTASLCLAGQEAVTSPKELERVENALEAVAKEDSSQDPMSRVVRQDDPFYPLPKSHHLLQKLLPGNPPPQPPPVYYQPQQQHYHLQPPTQQQTYHPQPPPPQQHYQIRPPPLPQVPCLPPSSVQISEGHIANQQTPTSALASVPYISGYRLTPIIGHKQIVVNDVAHNPGAVPCVEGTYTSYSYGHPKTAEDFLKPFEDAGYFVAPPDMSHQLREAQEYQDKIDDLNSHAEHLESLRKNAINIQQR